MIDVIFEGGRILDGSGSAAYATDIGLAGERIALIGNLAEREAVVRISCAGKTIAPGFIDVHSHSDELWLALPGCDGKIAQGVTTEIGGNCGTSAAPLLGSAIANKATAARRYGVELTWASLDEFLARVERNGIACNVGTLVGLGTTRMGACGDADVRLDDAQAAAQERLVREACEQGALGVSSGLAYVPSRFADSAELTALARTAAKAGRPLYVSHLRDEGDALVEAVDEALEIGRNAQVAVQCSHHKASGKRNWGKVERTLQRCDRARASGLDVHVDCYPYVASWTELATLLPDRLRAGGSEQTLALLADPREAAAIALGLRVQSIPWHDIAVASVGGERNAWACGQRVDAIAQRWQLSREDAVLRLLREEELDVEAIFFVMTEDDVASVFSASFCCVGSDASIRSLSGPTARGFAHPRTFGTFPRVFGRFVRGRHLLSEEEAVRRMTSLPAQIFRLRSRGSIAIHNYADLVVYDSANIIDTATYDQPYSYPQGIEHVFVNGSAVVRDGAFTGARPGRVLRGG